MQDYPNFDKIEINGMHDTRHTTLNTVNKGVKSYK